LTTRIGKGVVMESEQFEIFMFSNVGNSRANQEDNALIGKEVYLSELEVNELSDTRQTGRKSRFLSKRDPVFVAVSDGMGGHSRGEVASLMTVQYLSDKYHEIIDLALQREQGIQEEIKLLNQKVVSVAKSTPDCKGMGATLCGVVGKQGRYLGFNVGDSRLYQYSAGALKQLSKDHTEGQRLVDLNLLTESELLNFPRRKNIYKYIGRSGDLIADVFRISNCVSGSVLLLCSDGLTDALSDKELEMILSGEECIREKGDKMIEHALSRNPGCGDNITVVLLQF